MSTPIDIQFQDHSEIIDFLRSQGEISHALLLDDSFRRTLLIASASYIEVKVQEIIITFFESNSSNDSVVSFLKNKAIKRQYHTLFQWDGNNVNSFFGLFGSEFKISLLEAVKTEDMSDSIKGFLELGKLRNELVHQNYLNYTIQKSRQEIYELYGQAKLFVDFLESKMNGDDNATH